MLKTNQDWTITIGGENGWGGLIPAFTANSYPFAGRKNQASLTTDIDILDPNVLTQGLTPTMMAGGAVQISSILNTAVANQVTYGVGGSKLHQIGITAVSSTGIWPHTITGSGVITAHDVIHYKGQILYSYQDAALGGAGANGGNIGMYDLATTFNDTWWTATLGAAALENSIHYMILGGDDVVYITNGRYVATIEGTTDDAQALDFWQDSEVVSVSWNYNRTKIAVNRPNITALNVNQSAIYTWKKGDTSWEGDPIEVDGEIGAIYTQNGVTYVWWSDSSSGTYGHQFGYINGLQLVPLRRFYGNLPNQKQITTYRGFIAWYETSATATGSSLYLWGSRDVGFPPELFKYGTAKYAGATASNASSAMAAPFGQILISSYNGDASYDISALSGYSIKSAYKTRSYSVSGADYKSQIDLIMVEYETLATGAKCDFTLTYDKGATSKALTQIAYVSGGLTRKKILNRGPIVEDFRLDISWANGSATNPFKIRSIFIKGHTVGAD